MIEKFTYNDFSCDVENYQKEEVSKSVFRFYDKLKECDDLHFGGFVYADPGYGFICLNYLNDNNVLLSGYLSNKIFSSELIIDKAIEYLENARPELKNMDVRYHIECVDFTTYYEYNGEY